MTEILEILTANPLVLAAVLALAYNIGGYITQVLKIKKLEKYEVAKLGETLVLFETLFLVLSTIGGLSTKWTAVIVIAVAVVRSLKSALDKNTVAIGTTT